MTNFFKSDRTHFLSSPWCFSFLFLLLAALFLSSCTITKPGNYFKNITRDTTINLAVQEAGELKIKKGDVLSISISSLNREEDAIYNLEPNSMEIKDAGAVGNIGFLVDSDGYIFLHKLGKVKAEGLTRKELKANMEKALEPYLKDPIVTMNFGNHHVTVIGEIGKPQILQLTEDNISIIDVLAQSGSITPVSQLSQVMVIREKGNAKEFKHINLEDHSIFNSPYYYLQPNDIVVVGQNEKIVRQQQRRELYQQYSSVIFQSVSIAILIYQVFIRK